LEENGLEDNAGAGVGHDKPARVDAGLKKGGKWQGSGNYISNYFEVLN